MAKVLLEKTRRLNGILLNGGSEPVAFQDIANILNEILNANVYVISRKGRILGHSLSKGYTCTLLESRMLDDHQLPEEYNQTLLSADETRANAKNEKICDVMNENGCPHPGKSTTIVPINGGGERLGTLLFCRFDGDFTDDDLVLAEYSAAVVGMEIMRSKAGELEEEARKKAMVQLAVAALSYSELQAVVCILDELGGDEGLLVTSHIADRLGVARSVIINAMRKLESAGVIESRSLGMKGTHIRILNDSVMEELNKMR